MENQDQAAVQNAAPASTEVPATAPKEKKPRKMKKTKREDFIVALIKSGERDAQVIAVKLSEAAERLEISMKKVHKVPPTPLMWFLQVKWYFHQAKKKGLVDGDLILPVRERKPRQKKAAVAVDAAAPGADATVTTTVEAGQVVDQAVANAADAAPAADEAIGTI